MTDAEVHRIHPRNSRYCNRMHCLIAILGGNSKTGRRARMQWYVSEIIAVVIGFHDLREHHPVGAIASGGVTLYQYSVEWNRGAGGIIGDPAGYFQQTGLGQTRQNKDNQR